MALLTAGYFSSRYFPATYWTLSPQYWPTGATAAVVSTGSTSITTTVRTRPHRIKRYNLFDDPQFLSYLIEALEEI